MSLPYDYYPSVLKAINLVSQGHTVTAACDEADVNVSTLHNYLDRDENLRDMFTEAEQRGADAMADALINIDNHKIHGQSDPKMAKVISDNIKWVLAKRQPKTFGDRVQVDHSVTVDVAITSALDAAKRRVVADAPEVLDAEVIEDMSPEDADIMRELLS